MTGEEALNKRVGRFQLRIGLPVKMSYLIGRALSPAKVQRLGYDYGLDHQTHG